MRPMIIVIVLPFLKLVVEQVDVVADAVLVDVPAPGARWYRMTWGIYGEGREIWSLKKALQSVIY